MPLTQNTLDNYLQAGHRLPANRTSTQPENPFIASGHPNAAKEVHTPPAATEHRRGNAPKRVRTLFLSDIHLGTRACQSERLLAFLREYESDYLYLVGDIVDVWAMKRGFYWPAAHNTIVQKILRMARHNTKVIFVPGNHDEAFRYYLGMSFGGVDIVAEHVHETTDGKRLWVTHGDQYDQITTCHRWVSILGDMSYTVLVHVNRLLSLSRRKLNIGGHWSLADYAKRNVLQAVAFIGDFEKAAVHETVQRKFDGVVCGHIHTPAMKQVDGITYYNCGDWVDSCTALVEHMDGRMELLRSTPDRSLVPAGPHTHPAPSTPLAAHEESATA